MLYTDHGLRSFTGDYTEYFKTTDRYAITYLMLVGDLLLELTQAHHMLDSLAPGTSRPSKNTLTSATIAEDVSGYPTLCLPVQFGGIGFDYRLSMGVGDYVKAELIGDS
jgi:1,4-alpha-glucan branching enzyme